MKYSLIPEGYRKLMTVCKRIALIADMTILLPLAFFIAAGFHHTAAYLFYLAIVLTPIFTGYLIFFCSCDKVVQSTVTLHHEGIRVSDKKNRCWREISYNNVKAVAVKEVFGYFYGSRKDEFKAKYICFFLNDQTEIPTVSYKNLFRQRGFFMVAYTDEFWESLQGVYFQK